jgi:four helix bundle protein
VSFKNYSDLEVWKKAMDLVVTCYHATANFPKEEVYGLTSQIRRAAVSIPSNIAEGHSRQHTKEFINFLSMAYGSLAELETQIQLALRLDYLTNDKAEKLLNQTSEIARMINGLMRSLRDKQ